MFHPLITNPMKRWIAWPLAFTLGLAIALGLALPVRSQLVLQPVSPQRLAAESPALVGFDDLLESGNPAAASSPAQERRRLLTAIDYSLQYLRSPAAATAYANYPVTGISRDRVRRSLQRFRQLVVASPSAADLQTAVLREFEFYQSVGRDGLGTVDFTGYFEPTYRASRVPTAEFRYPIYRLPPDFDQWQQSHPTRAQLEGVDGLQGSQGPLRGLELAWLSDRLEAFLIQVQGSARLQLTDGSTLTVGFAGRTDYPYTGIGRALVDDGKLSAEGLTLPNVIAYFRQHPDEQDRYLPRNNRFIFFRETQGQPPTGSLSVPVVAERSIATDKSLMPPGALALIITPLPMPAGAASAQSTASSIQPTSTPSSPLEQQLVSRFVLDHDTGGAIRGPGRVDIFMGTGTVAGDRAGLINSPGQLYYLLLRN
ncbi:MAG TPA: murein transglycosylase A [Chroococcidiopsis sp.]